MAARQRNGGIGSWLAPPRFIMFCALFAAITAGSYFAMGQKLSHAVMIGFDIGAAAFMLSLLPIMTKGDAAAMRKHSAEYDANRLMLLFITGAVTVVIMVVVASELGGETQGGGKALILGTLTLAWLFSNLIYALHYAHLWYRKDQKTGKDSEGIEFPGTPQPDYWDFVYFAYTLGMTFQTSDLNITDQRVRRLATAHCFVAFIFNLGVIAFTINVLGSGGKG